MAKKKFDLDNNIQELVDKYVETTEIDWDELVNKALKYYITNKLGSKKLREMMKDSDSEAAKYLDEYVSNNIDSHWNI